LRYFILIGGIIAAFSSGHVIASSLTYDKTNSIAIQGFAPDPYATVSVKGPSSQMFNVKNKLAWQFYNSGANNCIGRILPMNAKGQFPSFPIFSGDKITYVVHSNTAFINLSGCSGVLLQQ